MKIATFSPEDVVLTLNDYRITDFAEGTFIDIRKNSENFRQERGIRGKHTRVHTRDRSGVLTFQLMQTSNQNAMMSQLASADDYSFTGLVVATVRDVMGQSGMQLGNAYLEGVPNVSYQGDTTTPREWKLNYEFVLWYDVGGNERASLDFLTNLIDI